MWNSIFFDTCQIRRSKPSATKSAICRTQTKFYMKWLTIDAIKRHSRIDYDCEDALLEMYGESAEETVLNIINRSYADVVEKFGTEKHPIPAPLVHASLLLVEESYTQRAPITQTNLYVVPYAFDMMVKPYMRLADETGKEEKL